MKSIHSPQTYIKHTYRFCDLAILMQPITPYHHVLIIKSRRNERERKREPSNDETIKIKMNCQKRGKRKGKL